MKYQMKKNDRNVCVFPRLDPPILPGFPSSFLSFPLSSLCAFSSTHLIFFSTLPLIFIHFSHACSSCSPLCVSVCLHIDKLLLILEKDTLHVVHSMRHQHKRLQYTHTHMHTGYTGYLKPIRALAEGAKCKSFIPFGYAFVCFIGRTLSPFI